MVFYLPRQSIGDYNYTRIASSYQVIRLVDLGYELENEATAAPPFDGDMQFLVTDPGSDSTVPCGLSGNPVRFGVRLDKTVNNSCFIVAWQTGNPQWGVYFHEIGHNHLALGTKINQFWGVAAPTGNTIFAEGLATALAMYAAKMIETRASSYSISQSILDSMLRPNGGDWSGRVWRFGTTTELNQYVAAGAMYSQMTPDILDEIIDKLFTKYGYDKLPNVYSIFLPRDTAYPFPLRTESDQATLFVAGVSAAVGKDLQAEFRAWGFPVNHTYYNEIWSAVTKLIYQRNPNLQPLIGIPLSTGWNLISLPLIPSDNKITSIGATVTSVWAYDAMHSSWKFYMPGKSSTLTQMTDGNGYWILMTHPDVLYVDGNIIEPGAAPPSYSLTVGWNLIGFKPQPKVANETVGSYLSSIAGSYDKNNVWTYDNQNGTWIRATDVTWLRPSQAMWVLMTSPATLRP